MKTLPLLILAAIVVSLSGQAQAQSQSATPADLIDALVKEDPYLKQTEANLRRAVNPVAYNSFNRSAGRSIVEIRSLAETLLTVSGFLDSDFAKSMNLRPMTEGDAVRFYGKKASSVENLYVAEVNGKEVVFYNSTLPEVNNPFERFDTVTIDMHDATHPRAIGESKAPGFHLKLSFRKSGITAEIRHVVGEYVGNYTLVVPATEIPYTTANDRSSKVRDSNKRSAPSINSGKECRALFQSNI
ncbi:MAG: hypothetical protein IPJ84_19320 [Bdellovibrionales bacterium]|nr:hypothetical protein [Bdellovibrionales bacterium]